MSSFTRCNYCTLKGIRQRLGENEWVVKRSSTWHTGINIYVVPKDVELPRPIIEDSDFHKQYFRCWFMALSQSCCCWGLSI